MEDHKDAGPDGGAERLGGEGAEPDEGRGCSQRVELEREVYDPQKLGRAQRRKRVAGGDQGGAQRRWSDGEVDRQRANEHGRPDPPPQDQDGHERYAGRRPDRRHLAVHQGEPQAQAARNPVSDGHQRQLYERAWKILVTDWSSHGCQRPPTPARHPPYRKFIMPPLRQTAAALSDEVLIPAAQLRPGRIGAFEELKDLVARRWALSDVLIRERELSKVGAPAGRPLDPL